MDYSKSQHAPNEGVAHPKCDKACEFYDRTAPNYLLCHACQPWDDLTHIVVCLDPLYAKIHPEVFFSGPGSGEMSNGYEGFDHGLQDLHFHSFEFYSPTKKCLLCAYVRIALSDAGYRATDDIAIATWRPFRFYDGSGHEQKHVERCILPICVKLKTAFTPLVLEIELSYVQSTKGLRQVATWDRRFCNATALRQWLNNCQTFHTEKCNQPITQSQIPKGFRLIDTTRRCVVEVPERAPYAALSYQWKTATAHPNRDILLQQSNLSHLEKPGSLRHDLIPEVVIDALQLCVDIGLQYVWIDRFCIVQDDFVNKVAQIEAMDAIYQLAEVTIVACADDVGAGLPGTSSRPRPRDLKNVSWDLGIDGNYVGASPQTLYQTVEQCEWNTRGWTYQERVLSRKHIFFSRGHVYVSCFADGEDIDTWARGQEIRSQHGQSLREGAGNRGFETTLRQEESFYWTYFNLFSDMIEKYSPRQLGYRCDILKAFTGVNNVACALAETQALFGIPERHFVRGLLWGYMGTVGRTTEPPGIPTWSWASWDGLCCFSLVSVPAPLSFVNIKHNYSFGQLISPFYCDLTAASRPFLRKLAEDRFWFEGRALREDGEVSIQDQILYNTDRRQRGGKDAVGLWSRFIHGPLESLRRREIDEETQARALKYPHCVVFNTTVATLRLDVLSQNNDSGTHVELGLYDKNDKLVGETALMQKDFVVKCLTVGASYHVIVLAANHMGKQNQEFFWSGKHPFYRFGEPWSIVVMITICNDNVHSRITLGQVTPETWSSVNPQWEPVILV